ncbi:MAG: NAD-dependent epimerase/dehydratase family protein [Gammaproteobacteria bacterium]
MKQKILITGDCGFVGMNLIDSFIENEPNTELIGLSKKTIASNDVIHPHKRYSCDINDVYNLNRILNAEKPDWIIHLAAEADVSRSYQYPYDFIRTNLIGTFDLLEWLRYNKETKIICASTDEVFGEVHNAKETDKLNPINPYSASKAATEQMVYAYTHCYDIDARIIRPFNIYGKYQKPNRLFAKIISNALMDKPFSLFADTANHSRGWIYGGNIYYAIKTVMDNGKEGEDYNFQYDAHLTVEQIKDKILDKLDKQDLFTGYNSGESRHKDDFFYDLSYEKIKSIGYVPKFSFDEGLDATINWYKQQVK